MRKRFGKREQELEFLEKVTFFGSFKVESHSIRWYNKRMVSYPRFFVFALVVLSLLSGCATKGPITAPKVDPRAVQSAELAANAQKMAKEGQFRGAIFFLEKAISLYSKIRNWEEAIMCHIRLSDHYQKLEQSDSAREQLNQALQLSRLHPIHKQLTLAKSFVRMGRKYLDNKSYDRAIEMYQKALAIQLRLLGKHHLELAKTYNKLALAYWNKGDAQKAEENTIRSQFIRARQFKNIKYDIKKKYRFLDKDETASKDLEDAKKFYNRSLINYQPGSITNEDLLAVINENLGIIYAFEGEFERSLEHLRKSFALRLELYGDLSPEVASNYLHIGVCLRLKGEYQEARRYLNIALTIRKKKHGAFHMDTADVYYQLGQINYQLKLYEEALRDYQNALIALTPDFSSTNVYKNPGLEKCYLKDRLLKTLDAKANTLKMLYLQEPARVKELRFSLKTYLLTTRLIEEIRRGYKSESYKLFFGEKSHAMYDEAIQAAILLYNATKEEAHKETAFMLSEKSKAAVLAEALAESRARRFSGIPDELVEKELQLKQELDLYDTLLQKEYLKKNTSNISRIKYLEEIYYSLKSKYHTLVNYFENNYQKYYDLKYNVHPVTLPQLKWALGPDTACVEYFVGDGILNIFVLTNETLQFVSLPADKEFFKCMDQCRIAIKKIEVAQFLRTSHHLHNKLIAPIYKWIRGKKKLVIIPHGKLYYVPFEALAPNGEGAEDLATVDYLIKKFAISYHYSGRLWHYTASAKKVEKEKSFIGFAPVFSDKITQGYFYDSELGILTDKNSEPHKTADSGINEDKKLEKPLSPMNDRLRQVLVEGEQFSQLPGTEEELKTIINLFKEKGKRAAGYFHSRASENQFKAPDMRDFSIIHVATHSLKLTENPKLSGLIFTQQKEGYSGDDGVLFSSETYSLNFDAELIVLSSCESGVGELVKGEGMIALNRGFLYSGVRNTVLSLWKVADHTTSRLMVEMYRNILDGKNYSEALREAKLSMLRDRFTAFPRYWSGFILVGE